MRISACKARSAGEIARLRLQDDVILAGTIPYRDLPAVYHHAFINIFASESENFSAFAV